jgi:hypothetical protein
MTVGMRKVAAGLGGLHEAERLHRAGNLLSTNAGKRNRLVSPD